MKKLVFLLALLFVAASISAQTKTLYEIFGKNLSKYNSPARRALATEAGITSGYIGSYEQNQKIVEYLQSKKSTAKTDEIKTLQKNACLGLANTITIHAMNGTQNVSKLISTDTTQAIGHIKIVSIDPRLDVNKCTSAEFATDLKITVVTVTRETSDEETLDTNKNTFFNDTAVWHTLVRLLSQNDSIKILATNGKANIFYVKNKEGTIYAIHLVWNVWYGGWYFYYHDWITPTGSKWLSKGDRVFSPIYNPTN